MSRPHNPHPYNTRFQSKMADTEPQSPLLDESLVNMDQSLNSDTSPKVPTRKQKDHFQQGLAQGKAFGLTGVELRDYVENYVQKEADRQAAREEADRQAAREEREHNAAIRAAEREHEFRMAQEQHRQHELPPRENANNNAAERLRGPRNIKLRIPFLEDKDNIEAWFNQFERTTEDHGLTEPQKARHIFYYLKGKARDLYSKMVLEDQQNFDLVKATIMKGFNLTGDDYRMRFRNSRKRDGESLKEMTVRLVDYFDRWISMAEVDEDYDQLRYLILKEQLNQIYPPELVQYIAEGETNTLPELLARVDKYESIQKLLKNASRASKTNKGGGNNKPGTSSKGNKDLREDQQPQKKVPAKELERRRKEKLCLNCGKPDHFAAQCPDKRHGTASCVSCKSVDQPHMVVLTENKISKSGQSQLSTGEIRTELSQLCEACQGKPFQSFVRVKINGVETVAMRDTGCTGIIVSPELVCTSQYTGKTVHVTLASSEVKKPLKAAVINVDSPYFHEDTEVMVMENSVHPVLIGQTYGLDGKWKTTPLFPVREPEWYNPPKSSVVTRLQAHKEKTDTTENKYMTQTLEPAKLRKAQSEDPSLRKIRQYAEGQKEMKGVTYTYKNEVLLRVVTDRSGTKHSKVVVPASLREQVLRLGHDNALAGHLGVQKTTDRIVLEFWWPGIIADIKRYVASCDTCQRTCHRGRTPHAPLGKMPPVDVMFRRVAVDIIGPISPISESKKQYILVMMDYNTRYPEAVALKDIKAETVLDALWEIWTRLGIPDEIVTDQGSQFSGHLMAEVKHLWRVKHSMTTAFHPQANGLVEKFNGTLKSMLKKLAIEEPNKWDTFIPALLFAYREVPQQSTGFSPFEMIYGRKVKGPMQILREIWTQEEMTHEMKTSAEYVVNLRNRIEETCKIARENLSKAHKTQAKYFDRRTKRRVLKPGKQVLLLLPTKHNKLELTWKGPYQVLEQIGDVDYRIQMGSKSKVFHINLMKEYLPREKISVISTEEELYEEADQITDGRSEYSAVVITEEPLSEIMEGDDRKDIILPAVHRTEDDTNVHIAPQMTEKQKRQVQDLCHEYREFLTDVPRTMNLEECTIELNERKPVFVRPRPIPHSLVESVEKEVEDMLQLGVIEHANSPYNSPIVMVKKRDGKHRFCADLRALNNVTMDDREPISDVEHIFQGLGKAKYFSKLDLTKGYWAIPIKTEDRKKTAFTTTTGQYQWVNLPFGIKNCTRDLQPNDEKATETHRSLGYPPFHG